MDIGCSSDKGQIEISEAVDWSAKRADNERVSRPELSNTY